MGTLLQVTLCFSLAAFKILFLSLTFGILMMMCVVVVLFGSKLFGTLCVSWTYMSISFTKLGKFSFIIFSNTFSISCSSSSSQISPFNISCNKGLVMMNSFSFTLSGKHFICPQIVNDSFAGQSNLGCRSLFLSVEYFLPVPTSLHSFF